MWVGVHCLSCKADGVSCKKNYVWLTNYVQNLRVIAQLFAGWIGMKKGHRIAGALLDSHGGDEGDRTPDLLTASQALSQLSYAPVRRSTIREHRRRCKDNFRKTFRGASTDAGHTQERGARDARSGPRRRGPRAAATPPPSFPAPFGRRRGPPATKPAHLLRLAGIPRPWRLGQK